MSVVITYKYLFSFRDNFFHNVVSYFTILLRQFTKLSLAINNQDIDLELPYNRKITTTKNRANVGPNPSYNDHEYIKKIVTTY